MEYLIVAVLKLPDHATDSDIARLEAKLVEHIDLDSTSVIYGEKDRKPRVYWSFHPLNVPFPISWKKDGRD